MTALLAGLLSSGSCSPAAGARAPSPTSDAATLTPFVPASRGSRRPRRPARRDAARGLVADDHDRAARRRDQRLVRGRPGADLRARRGGGPDRHRLPRGPRPGPRGRSGARSRSSSSAIGAHRGPAGAHRLRLVAVRDALRARRGGGRAGLRTARRADGRRRSRPSPSRRSSPSTRTSAPTARRTCCASRSASSPPGSSRSWPSPTPRISVARMQRVHRPVANRSADRPLQPVAAVRDARAGGQPHAPQRPRLLRADDRPRRPEGDQRQRRPPSRRRGAARPRRGHPRLDPHRRLAPTDTAATSSSCCCPRPTSSAPSSWPRRSASARRRSASAPGGGEPITSVSIGLVSPSRGRRSAPRSCMAAADRAMYQAKKLGKNQISGNPRPRPALLARRSIRRGPSRAATGCRGAPPHRCPPDEPTGARRPPPRRRRNGADGAGARTGAVAVELGPIVVRPTSPAARRGRRGRPAGGAAPASRPPAARSIPITRSGARWMRSSRRCATDASDRRPTTDRRRSALADAAAERHDLPPHLARRQDDRLTAVGVGPGRRRRSASARDQRTS